MRQPYFWAEVFIVLLFPYPVQADSGFLQPHFYMQTVNWVDASGAYPAQSHKYDTPYLTSDVFLALMFLRLYFVIQAVIVLSPVNKLYAKRICFEAGFEPTFGF